MKQLKIFLLFLLVIIYAQNIQGELINGSRPLGMTGAFTTFDDDINALDYNPAGISGIRQYSLLFTYMPIYQVDNLFHFKLAAVIPFFKPRIGISFYNVSLTDTYSLNRILLGCGYALNEFLSVGFNLKFYTHFVQLAEGETSYRSRLTYFSMDTGFLARFIKWLSIGISAKDLTDPKIKYKDESSNYDSIRTFTTGLRFHFTDSFSIALDEEFKKNEDMILKFGSELWFYNTVAVRAGISKNDMYGIGIGLKTLHANVDFALQSHPFLGNQYIADLTAKF
ncbi:MAG: hypothetical protein KKH98_15430 [Spirochaetes bacterium]|nr:hypothetical protein [Spirochaetota bacterium]